MRLPVNRLLPFFAPIFLAGCLGEGGGDVRSAAEAPTNGPGADYPVVVGEPFTIGSITHTPEDKLNYDAVGYAIMGGEGVKLAAAHKTLPLPSYVEVTELVTGRTALVRVERRGPMRNDMLVELTPAAAAQLGITSEPAPVRVRRVNPPEADRALLRAGEQAPLRMDTPMSLVAVLKRKLDNKIPSIAAPLPAPALPAASVPAVASIDPHAPVASGRSELLATAPQAEAEPAPVKMVEPPAFTPGKPAPEVSPAPQATKTTGKHVVQIGTFSTRERAETAAKPMGGTITPSGKFWIVRSGPFNSAGEAAAALEKARKSGYRDAIFRRID